MIIRWILTISLATFAGNVIPDAYAGPIPVAFWALDEDTGTVIVDSSGNGLTGIAQGAAIVAGIKGKARTFNGNSNYLEVPDTLLLDIRGQITIMFWVKLDPAFANGHAISKRVYSSEMNYSIKLGDYGSNPVIIFSFGPLIGYASNVVRVDLKDDRWHHVAHSFVFGNPSSAKWVIDGSSLPGFWSQGDSAQIPDTNSADLQIGRQLSVTPDYFLGSLDQIRIYNQALNEQEIRCVYLAEASVVFGDADGNKMINISDAVYLISYIFGGGPAPAPLLAGDANCDGVVNISDAVFLISYIFGGGPAPCAGC